MACNLSHPFLHYQVSHGTLLYFNTIYWIFTFFSAERSLSYGFSEADLCRYCNTQAIANKQDSVIGEKFTGHSLSRNDLAVLQCGHGVGLCVKSCLFCPRGEILEQTSSTPSSGTLRSYLQKTAGPPLVRKR